MTPNEFEYKCLFCGHAYIRKEGQSPQCPECFGKEQSMVQEKLEKSHKQGYVFEGMQDSDAD